MPTPQDRLQKFGRRTYVGIFSDDQLQDDVDVAQRALEVATTRADRTRTLAVANIGALDDRAGEIKRIDAERAAAVKPFEDEVDRAQTDLDKSTLWFAFRSIGRQAWYDLIAANPATEADNEQMQATGLGTSAPWHRESLEPEIVVAASFCPGPGYQPAITAQQWAAMTAAPEWNEHELAALFGKAVVAQTQGRMTDEVNRPR